MKDLISAIILLLSVCCSDGRVICSRDPSTGTIRYCYAGYYCCNGFFCCKIKVTTDYQERKNPLSGGAIAGIVIGSIFGVFLSICVWDECQRRKSAVRSLDTGTASAVSASNAQNPAYTNTQSLRFGVSNGMAIQNEQARNPLYAQLPGSTVEGMPPRY